MRADFKALATIASCVTAALFLVLAGIPELIFWLFGIEGGISATFMARRAGCLFLGISVLLWCAAHDTFGSVQKGICGGVAIMMAALAILGTIEFLVGTAGVGIWMAIFVEVAFSFGFARLIWVQGVADDKA